ncbi:UbiA family prenyltransferase [Thermomonospora amylolytica]|uniref:UbiA family prenyltransferase n=1 Tax=Thermomonospora amylolytica TaxID=1411117 RepID=UPI000E6CDF16|nr:UbiA family prenyltransferase [Thermomonospora amylolytica]
MAANTGVRASPGLLKTVVSYARLAKFEFVLDFYLALVVAWTALRPDARLDGVVLGTLVLYWLGQTGVLAAVMTLDDVNGVRDGSDQANYLGGSATELRPLRRKPLLTGALTVQQALRFGHLAIVWGALWWIVAAAVAPHQPAWVLVTAALLLTLSVQYSWGLRLSYRGLGEALLLLSPAGFVVVPYGLAAGELPGLLLVEALLFGFGQLLIGAYSNTNDIEGDAAVGRRTVAVLTSPRGNRIFLGALTAANLLLIALPSVTGWGPWWFAAALAPAAALRLRQYGSFLRTGDPLVARRRGVVTFRVTVACTVVANLLYLGW